MARIPTISASSITGLPGTAGGVKLTRTGVGAVPISTPITQRLNPSQYGQEGAAMAQLGAEIFNSGVLPAIELSRKNARAEQSMKQSKRLYDEMSAIKNELALNVLPQSALSGLQGEHKEAAAWTKHWNGINSRIDQLLPSITANVSDKRHAVALSNAFMPQIMALKLKSQNRQVKVSEDRTTHAYIESQRMHVAEIMSWMPTAPTKVNGEETYVFQGKKIEGALQRMELTATVFANSGVNPLDRQKILDKARKNLVDEVAGTLQTNPKMGEEFLKAYGTKLGMTAGEIGDTITKMQQYGARQSRWENAKADQEETKKEQAAQADLNVMVDYNGATVTQVTKLKMQAHAGELNWPDFYKTWANKFHEADYQTHLDDIEALINPTDLAAGETNPEVYSDYADEITLAIGNRQFTNDDINALENRIFADKKRIKMSDQQKLVGLMSVMKELSTKNPRFQDGLKFLTKQAPVPVDKYDTGPAAQRSRAIWNTWMTDINALKEKNDPAAWRKFDFFGRAKEIVNEQSDLWSQPSSVGAQILFKEQMRKFGEIFGDENSQKWSVSPSKDSQFIFPDVTLMQKELQERHGTMNPDQIKRANDIINTVKGFSGLAPKVTDINNAKLQEANSRLQAKKLELEEKLESQKTFRERTPDQVEEIIKENFPGWYKEKFGGGQPKTETKPETPKTETQPVPEPKKTSVTTDNRQAEMFQPTVTLEEISEIGKRLNLDPGDLEELIQRGQQVAAQVDEEVTRLDTLAAEQEQLAVQSSEAQVFARRAEEKQAEEERQAEAAAQVEELETVGAINSFLLKQEKDQIKKEKENEFWTKFMKEEKEAAKKSATGLEDKKKYPDKRLLERLRDLHFRSLGNELSAIEKKEMETIKKEVKARKLKPLALG